MKAQKCVTGHHRIDAVKLRQYEVKGLPWFAVIDAAQDPTLPKRAADSRLTVESLYAGRLGSMVAEAAPHLATLDLSCGFAGWLLERWRANLGILIQSRAPFADLRKHLRRFLTVKDATRKRYRFRFYDPRVLRAFLPTCAPEELKDFFGPVERFHTPSRTGRSILTFSLPTTGLFVSERRCQETKRVL